MLESLGYTAITMTNPLKALEIFRAQANDFDLLITDSRMPEMNGEDLIREILKIRPDLPVILATGYANSEDTTVSGTEILGKPFNIQKLSQVVAAQIEKAKAK